ncbi:conserved hypothetical protein [uncultured Paludibacter sp.]|uniref:Anti-FecI sigma factor, FecR n=1 Tax=uncultured Paludibacter sp. TaxID=497635 RepID=A0A653A6P7_9BACT|nr:conserved hypothetical protein [uncultured Paludibacter sp.]
MNKRINKQMNNPDKKTIDKVIEGTATKEQAREVAKWFSTTVEGQSYLSELISLDAHRLETEDFSKLIPTNIHSKDMYDEIMRRIAVKHIRNTWMKVAAILIPLFLIAGLAYYANTQVDLFGGSEYTEIYVPKGERQHIIFQDGSEAYLNSDTRLKYPTKFGIKNRKVSLNGEGYFKISKNKKRPFIVQMENTNVTVLGTMFNTKAYNEDNEMRILLDEGSIVFNVPQNNYKLIPGQQAIYDKKSGKCTIYSLSKPADESAWRNDVIVFKDTPLSDVLKTLNRKFNVEFEVKNTQSIAYSYTLTTSQASLEKVISELEKIAPVRFTIHQNKVDVFLK